MRLVSRFFIAGITLIAPLAAAHSQPLPKRPGTRQIDSIATAAAHAQRESIAQQSGARPDDPVSEKPELKNTATGGDNLFIRFTHLFWNDDEKWCNPPKLVDGSADTSPSLQFCHLFFDSRAANRAAKQFWDGHDSDGNDVAFARLLNFVGNQKAQSLKLELLSDYWSSIRIGFYGTMSTKASGGDSTDSQTKSAAAATTAAAAPDAGTQNQSKAQQFLNNGGPAGLRIDRPFAVLNLFGTNSVVFGHALSSFSIPGASTGSAPADSIQFAATGLHITTQVDGALGKIGGVGSLYIDRNFGSRKFYAAATGDSTAHRAFNTASFSLGLVLEGAVQLTWTKVVSGPGLLQHGSSFFTINATR